MVMSDPLSSYARQSCEIIAQNSYLHSSPGATPPLYFHVGVTVNPRGFPNVVLRTMASALSMGAPLPGDPPATSRMQT